MDKHKKVLEKRSSGEEIGDSSNIFKRKGTQSTINAIFKKNEREDACQEMVRFFYHNVIPFNVANNEEFKRMVELIGRHVFLKSIDAYDVCKTAEKIFKMIDDIVEEVGENNVIQVVTNNAANYKAAEELLM